MKHFIPDFGKHSNRVRRLKNEKPLNISYHLGIIGVSYILGAINFMFVEYPAAKIEKLLLSR